ncbi:MAG: GGDEF domain-containing protein [Clostridium sp.]|nr:GGDEF domain-containing protein [Clostridium sp.]
MDGIHEENSVYDYGIEKYHALIEMDCCCFFEYDLETDRLAFSNNNVIPELSGRVIEHCAFQLSNVIVDRDVPIFAEFLHFAKEYPIEFRIKGYVLNAIWCQARGTAIRDEKGNVISFVGYIVNIDDKKREFEERKTKSRQDELTGVWNSFAIKELINGVLHTSDSVDRHAFLILDLEEFKELNQRLGFQFGNVVLNNIAESIKLQLAEEDLIGRVGRDEFVIFLRDIDSVDSVQEMAEQIQHIVSETYSGEAVDIEISSRIGISFFPEHGTRYVELFSKADMALYDAKKTQNGYRCFSKENWSYPKLPEGQLYYNIYELSDYDCCTKSDIDMELVHFAMDLLSNTKDVGSAVNVLIDKIGHYFGTKNVVVVERDKGKPVISYSWSVREGLGCGKIPDNCIGELFEVAATRVKGKSCCITELDWEKCLPAEMTMLLCGWVDDEQLKGYVYMDRSKECGHWSKQEVDSSLFISKIISFYLLKLRNSEKITEKMEMAKNYDSLTGLPTLHKFTKDARILVESFRSTKFAIIYFDIKNFKYINDSLGYDKGDQLLKELATYLRDSSVSKQISARASADNFLTLIPYTDKEQLKNDVVRNFERFSEIQNRENIAFNIGIVAGIYMLKENDKDFMAAIDNANIARKLVKNSSVERCAFYDDNMEMEIRKEQMIISNMQSALDNEEFQVYLQPKIDLVSGKISGAEALVRWRRSDGSMLPPNDFIPLFEKNGFVVKLDFYIYEQVCKLLRRWKQSDRKVVPISVNVSRVHLYHDDFLEKVMELVNCYDVEPWMIEFELTESIFLNNTVTAITVMKELRKLGFCVSIDDFGAGYSSLNLLKDMRTDVLKLDKEFFREGEMQNEERIIVSSIISMAKQLNMKVLSEGVETQMQSDFLKTVECDMAQGYLYARPLPVNEFEQLLDSYGG